MSEAWSIVMLISGALFIAGVVPIAWERAPAWRAADHATFRVEFAHTLRRVDRLQPALLLVCLVSSVGFAVSGHGAARTLAGLAAACLVAVLVGSGAGLVPIQRRLVDPGSDLSASDVERLRASRVLARPLRQRITSGSESSSTSHSRCSSGVAPA